VYDITLNTEVDTVKCMIERPAHELPQIIVSCLSGTSIADSLGILLIEVID
jgi:hypothetical protein